MKETILSINHISKQYTLGQIGGTTLREELQRKKAKFLKREDPTRKIGAREYVDGETFMALDDVSFDVSAGERVGIIGRNGAGKSTLLKLISRITAPTSGEIGLNGRVASMLEVGTGFHGELTGRENIYMNGAILGMNKREIDRKIDDIIDFSECSRFIDTPVKRYSSGMYVKLAFSVAAHLDAEIMIMDEVLAVGDMTFQKKCLDKMADLSKTDGRTILYVSHNMNTIRQLCERCIVLNSGKVLYNGDVDGGIEKYLGTSGALVTDVLVTDEMRHVDLKHPMIRIKRITMICDEGAVKQGSVVPIEFEIENIGDFDKNIDVRILVDSGLGSRIMMSMTKTSIMITAKCTIKKRFLFDCSILTPDTYYLSAILIEEGFGASYINLDVLKSVIRFMIPEEGDIRDGQIWKTQVWGNVFNGYLLEDN